MFQMFSNVQVFDINHDDKLITYVRPINEHIKP